MGWVPVSLVLWKAKVIQTCSQWEMVRGKEGKDMCVCKRGRTVRSSIRMGWDHMVSEASTERFVFRVRVVLECLWSVSKKGHKCHEPCVWRHRFCMTATWTVQPWRKSLRKSFVVCLFERHNPSPPSLFWRSFRGFFVVPTLSGNVLILVLSHFLKGENKGLVWLKLSKQVIHNPRLSLLWPKWWQSVYVLKTFPLRVGTTKIQRNALQKGYLGWGD